MQLGGYDAHKDSELVQYCNRALRHELAFYEWACERFDREAKRYRL